MKQKAFFIIFKRRSMKQTTQIFFWRLESDFKFDFLENEFWADWGVRFKFHFQNLT